VEPANLFIAALPAERRWVMSGTPTVDGEGTSGAEGALMQVRVRVRVRARARARARARVRVRVRARVSYPYPYPYP
jgi:hypothetical protein